MIYFISAGDGGPIKIGKCKVSVRKRIKTLQIGSAIKLVPIGQMEGSTQEEDEIHSVFDRYRIHGEWFNPAEELLSFIRANCTPIDMTEKRRGRGKGENTKGHAIVVRCKFSDFVQWRNVARRRGTTIAAIVRDVLTSAVMQQCLCNPGEEICPRCSASIVPKAKDKIVPATVAVPYRRQEIPF